MDHGWMDMEEPPSAVGRGTDGRGRPGRGAGQKGTTEKGGGEFPVSFLKGEHHRTAASIGRPMPISSPMLHSFLPKERRHHQARRLSMYPSCFPCNADASVLPFAPTWLPVNKVLASTCSRVPLFVCPLLNFERECIRPCTLT